MTIPDNGNARDGIYSAASGIRRRLETMTGRTLREESALPGWDRGHLLAHIRGVTAAMTRQIDFALTGGLVAVYDGGTDDRNAQIEAGAQLPAGELIAAVEAALTTMQERVRSLTEAELGLPISFRNGTVADGLNALWRELVIHEGDVVPGTQRSWSRPFCEHLFDFLGARVPGDYTFRIMADGVISSLGTGPTTLELAGSRQEVAEWLAGRSRGGGISAGGRLPALLPWPAAVPAP